jgi:hypothetical protein
VKNTVPKIKLLIFFRFGEQIDPYYPMNGLPTVPKELFLGMNAIETQDYSDQISKIFSIYQSNSFDDGVGIQRHGFMKKS